MSLDSAGGEIFGKLADSWPLRCLRCGHPSRKCGARAALRPSAPPKEVPPRFPSVHTSAPGASHVPAIAVGASRGLLFHELVHGRGTLASGVNIALGIGAHALGERNLRIGGCVRDEILHDPVFGAADPDAAFYARVVLVAR